MTTLRCKWFGHDFEKIIRNPNTASHRWKVEHTQSCQRCGYIQCWKTEIKCVFEENNYDMENIPKKLRHRKYIAFCKVKIPIWVDESRFNVKAKGWYKSDWDLEKGVFTFYKTFNKIIPCCEVKQSFKDNLTIRKTHRQEC